MPLLGNIAWEIFRAADTAIVRTGIRESRVGQKGLASLNRLGTKVLRAMLSARSKPFLIRSHRMWLTNSGSPSLAYTLSMVMGRYDQGTTRLVERLLKPGMTVIDVGAHVGYFALEFARLVGAEGKVYAFEPDSSNLELLMKNISLNTYGNISTHKQALAEHSGWARLFLNSKGSDRHSLLVDKEQPPQNQNTTEVETLSLDEFLEELDWPTIDLLKIDAEGAEYSIIKGMRRSLEARKVRIMIFEFTPSACEANGIMPEKFLWNLYDSGFDLYWIEATGELAPIPRQDFDVLIGQIQARGACNLLAERRKTN